VTITATSVANPNVSISSNPITINPNTTSSISFIPSLPAQVQINTTVNLVAAVANDASNTGVDWQVCASGCGFFTIKPEQPAIPATATTPYVPEVPAVTATAVAAWPNGLSIPYTGPPQPPSSGGVTVIASAHADPSKTVSGTIEVSSGAGGAALQGMVQAGSEPVSGAVVALYAAGTSGYASAAIQVASASSDKNGSFTIPAGYTCPLSSSQMYLVASGGQPGVNTANPDLALMTALGSCNSLGSAPVVVNEVTTVASAFATAPFAANDALNGNSSYLYLGTSSSNQTGLANAFAAVNNLVNIATGQARFVTPVGNAAVPYVEINTLADMLNACTTTGGGVEGDGSTCGILFAVTDVLPNHTLYNSIGPADTLQAIFNIAQHPAPSYGYTLDPSPSRLLPLAAASSAFQPILTEQPNDWSISLNYTGGGGLSAASTVNSFAMDMAGNLWITDTAGGSVIEWNAVGAAISPATGFAAGGGPLAIDAGGNVWISGDGKLTELTSFGSPAPGSPFDGVAGGGNDIVFDAQSNLWIANGDSVSEFSDFGVPISPKGGFVNNYVTGITAVGVDSSNNVWLENLNSNNPGTPSAAFAELTNPGGQLIVNESYGVGTLFPGIASDNAGNVWGVIGGSSEAVCPIQPYSGSGSGQNLATTCFLDANQQASGNGRLFFNARGIAIDGSATAWVASQGGESTSQMIPPSVLALSPPTFSPGVGNSYLVAASLAAGPLRVAIDGSGNVWVLLANNTITEYVGVATPAVTPTSAALASKKLGAKP
jgi:hypothetical protein